MSLISQPLPSFGVRVEIENTRSRKKKRSEEGGVLCNNGRDGSTHMLLLLAVVVQRLCQQFMFQCKCKVY